MLKLNRLENLPMLSIGTTNRNDRNVGINAIDIMSQTTLN